MKNNTIIRIDLLKAENMTNYEKEEYKLKKDDKGLVISEFGLDVDKSKEETLKLIQIYKEKGIEEATNYYHKQHEDTVKQAFEYIKEMDTIKTRSFKQVDLINKYHDEKK